MRLKLLMRDDLQVSSVTSRALAFTSVIRGIPCFRENRYTSAQPMVWQQYEPPSGLLRQTCVKASAVNGAIFFMWLSPERR